MGPPQARLERPLKRFTQRDRLRPRPRPRARLGGEGRDGSGGEGGGTSAVAAVSGALAVAQVARLLSPRSSGWTSSWSRARTARLAAGRDARAADASPPAGRRNRTPSRGTSGCVREPAGQAGAGGNTSSDRRAAPRPSAPPSGPSSAGSHWAGTRRGHRRVRTRKPHEELRADNRQAAGGRGRREKRRARPRRGRSNSYIPIYEYMGASDLCRAAAVIIPDPDETSPGIASRSVARGPPVTESSRRESDGT